MMRRLHFTPAVACVLLASLLLSAFEVVARSSSDKYFRKVKSRANVYVAPYTADIDKVAMMPFKAPTELIGASVSDLFVTEMLRAGRYTLVERGKVDHDRSTLANFYAVVLVKRYLIPFGEGTEIWIIHPTAAWCNLLVLES